MNENADNLSAANTDYLKVNRLNWEIASFVKDLPQGMKCLTSPSADSIPSNLDNGLSEQ